jgi:mannose-6-phosphate isomerase-like protein (cupin superfamily)
MDKVNIAQKLNLFSDHWSPKIVGELNGQEVKLVKLKGEFIIVPRGVEHKPVAETEEVSVMLFEPASTLNTGDTESALRKDELERI